MIWLYMIVIFVYKFFFRVCASAGDIPGKVFGHHGEGYQNGDELTDFPQRKRI